MTKNVKMHLFQKTSSILFLVLIHICFAQNHTKPLFEWSYKLNNVTSIRIFDTFMYNNEADMLYIHIWRLYYYIDYFIILTSPVSFSGFSRTISFHPYEKELEKFKDKMHIVTIDKRMCDKENHPDSNPAWCSEFSMRDYAKNVIENDFNATTDDIILITDCDEIFTRDAILKIRENPPDTFYWVRGVSYFPYYFHFLQEWNPVLVVRYSKDMKPLSIQRASMDRHAISNEVWVTHCSYCFPTLEQFKYKIQTFSHQEYNQWPYNTNDYIFRLHYCREHFNVYPGHTYDVTEPYTYDIHQYIPDDRRLDYLFDPSFEYPLNLTSYNESSLKTICNGNVFNREKRKNIITHYL